MGSKLQMNALVWTTTALASAFILGSQTSMAAGETADPNLQAASAPAVAASAPAAAASDAQGSQANPPAPAKVQDPAAKIRDLYQKSYVVQNLAAIMPNGTASTKKTVDGEYIFAEEFWNKPVKIDLNGNSVSSSSDGYNTIYRISNDGNLFFQNSLTAAKRNEVTTYNKLTKKLTHTVFNDSEPQSHTVVDRYGQYTITQDFCQLLKDQTKSESFQQMAATAKQCNVFYTKPPAEKAHQSRVQKVIDTHRENIASIKDIDKVKSVIPETPKTGWRKGVSLLPDTWLPTIDWAAKFAGSDGLERPVTPRPVLNAKDTAADERGLIESIAQDCDAFWTKAEKSRSATGSGAATTKSQKVSQ